MTANPSPLNYSVLTRQSDHKSSIIWDPADGDMPETPLIVRLWDSRYWDLYASSPNRVKEYIDMLRVGGVSRIGYHTVDWGLITVLVERWRPETHTFHFTSWEATISLQDIALFWGLPIDGESLIKGPCTLPREHWQQECFRLLGLQAPIDAFESSRMKKVNLMTHMLLEFPDNPTDEICLWRARSLIPVLIGGLLFSNRSGSKLNLRYLPFLEDLKRPVTLSWGSDVLAYLYRSLCTALSG